MSAPQNLDILTTAMEAAGYSLVSAEAGMMDSGSAAFSDGMRTVKIWKDRSQWMFDGSHAELEPLGLWRAFDETEEFRDALLAYIQRPMD